MKIYNTLGRKLEEFKPLEEGKVKVYQCGPTVYSRQHIGNLSSAVRGDLIRRSLDFLGYQTTFTRNITDVGHLTGDNEGDADTGEDKMAKGSKKEGLTPDQIAQKYTDLYHQDIKKLNVKNPDYETIATEYINQMGAMVQTLIDKGFAYAREKAIYFEVDKFSEYNKLNLQKLDQNIQGAGHGDVEDSEKKKPYDFAVWFFKTGTHSNALQTWNFKFEGIDQPILEGFPGWHIECSAMAKDTLGETIDIHIGGIEHIPVHHTNEIAQSESANGKLFSQFWLHHELLLIDGGKMSKSLGNVYSIDDLEQKDFDALDYRYFLLQAHYRSKQNFTWEALESAKTARKNLIQNLSNRYQNDIKFNQIDTKSLQKFKENLEEDFNIPAALAVVWDILKSDLEDEVILSTIFEFDKVLGLNLEQSVKNYLDNKNKPEQYSEEAKKLIEEREKARNEKDWQKADQIRDRLKAEFNIEIIDQK